MCGFRSYLCLHQTPYPPPRNEPGVRGKALWNTNLKRSKVSLQLGLPRIHPNLIIDFLWLTVWGEGVAVYYLISYRPCVAFQSLSKPLLYATSATTDMFCFGLLSYFGLAMLIQHFVSCCDNSCWANLQAFELPRVLSVCKQSGVACGPEGAFFVVVVFFSSTIVFYTSLGRWRRCSNNN